MTLEEYIDNGLRVYTSGIQRSDSQIDSEALRLEEEYTSKSSGDRNIERAKEMFKEDPDFIRRVEAMQDNPDAFRQSLKPMGLRVAQSTFPETMGATSRGSNFPVVSAVKDIAGYPLRYGEALLNKANPLSDPTTIESRMSQENTGDFFSDAIRSPYNVMPVSRAGQGLASLAKAPLQKGLSHFGKGAVESMPSALMEQGGRIEQGMGFSPSEFATEVIAGGALPVGGKVVKRALFGVKDDFKRNGISEVAKSALSATSGKSKELLSYIGADEFKDGIKGLVKSNIAPSEKISKIQNYSKNAEDVVGGIIDFVDTGFKDQFINSNGNVQHALKEMGEIDISDIVLDLNKKKKSILDPRDPMKNSSRLVPSGHSTGDESIDIRLANYDNIINKLTGKNYGEQRFTVPASDLYDIRKDIDKSINFDRTKYSTGLASELTGIPKDVRNKLAEKLRKAGDETTFPSDMKTFHEGLNLADELSKSFGDGTNLDKSARFLTTLGNPNKLQNKILAKKLERFLGKDLFEEAQLLKLSKEYNDGLSIYNESTTGRSLLAPVLGEKLAGKAGAFMGATMGSPKLAGPMMRGIEIAEESADYLSPQIKKLMRSGQTEYIGE